MSKKPHLLQICSLNPIVYSFKGQQCIQENRSDNISKSLAKLMIENRTYIIQNKIEQSNKYD